MPKRKAMTGQRVRDLRKALMMSQAEFAEHMGVTQASVSYWENERKGHWPPQLRHGRRLLAEAETAGV